MVYENRRHKRIISLILALIMVFTVCAANVFAESGDGGEGSAVSNIPSPSANYYVHDDENILSSDTKSTILTRNATLYEKYGIQIIVLTMDEIPGADINAKGQYLHQIIDSWQAGGTSEKCLMLVLSVNEKNYVAVAGDGLSAEFPVETWSTLFTQYLEPDFAAEQYDAGVLKFFNAIADKAELYAATNNITAADPAPTATEEPTESAQPDKKEEGGSGFVTFLRVVGTIILIVILLLIIGFIVIYAHGQWVLKKRREARRRKEAQNSRAAEQKRRASEDYNDFMNRY